MSTQNDVIKFAIPVDIEKGKNAKGDTVYKFSGLASTTDKDTAGEELYAKQFDLSNFKTVNWNHKAKDDANAILGEVVQHNFDKRGLNVYGELYPEMPMVPAVVSLMKAMQKRGKKLQLSVEGQVLERGHTDKKHPLYNKVLKARLTGVAITPNAVNQNTFAELIEKGETINDWQYDLETEELMKSVDAGKIIEDEKEVECPTCKKSLVENLCKGCGYMHKAMTASTHTVGESVEGAHDKNLKVAAEARTANTGDKNILSKSYLYEQIFNYFYNIDINKATQIYQLAEKISNMEKKPISQETLNKAFEIINIASAENSKNEKTVDAAVELIKSEDFDGLEKSEVVEKLEKSHGFDKNVAEEAAEKQATKKKVKKDKKDDKGEKGEKKEKKEDDNDNNDDDDNDMDEVKKSLETLRIKTEEFQTNADIKTGAIGVILKSQNDTIDALMKSNEALTETLASVKETLDKVAKTPIYKSNLGTAIERFEKSEDGFNTFNLKNKVQRKALADKIADLAGNPGTDRFDASLYKSAQDIEMLGVIGSAKTIKYLEEVHKIKVINGAE